MGINAFGHKWVNFMYIFSPLNLISRILRKIKENETSKVMMVVPQWTDSPRFPVLKEMCVMKPMILKHHDRLL